VPYSQRYLFNAIPDTNHNAKPDPTTLPTLILDNIVNKSPTSQGQPKNSY